MAFNPKEHMTNLKGKDYLEVKWRLVWFREDHPSGNVQTEPVVLSEASAIVRAVIWDGDGNQLASGMATVRSADSNRMSWAGRDFEKAETAAIGRALAHAGYGTQFTDEDEGDYLADSPVQRGNRNNASLPKYPVYAPDKGNDFDYVEGVMHVETIEYKAGKRMYKLADATMFTRDALTSLGYNTDSFDVVGVHTLPDAVTVKRQQSGKYTNIIALKRESDKKVISGINS